MILNVLSQVIQFHMLFLIFIGTMIGIIAAAIPGFTIVMAVILVFPFTYAMTPLQGLAIMIGVYVGGFSGGQISGILLGIPGTPSSVATVFDGHPMARKGRAGEALGLGIMSSFIGGLIGAVIMILLSVPIARFGLQFGPWEYFSLIALALTLLATLSSDSLLKGLTAGAFGLLLGTVGLDAVSGQPRLTLGFSQLIGGIDFLPVMIGLFAFSQLLETYEERMEDDSNQISSFLETNVRIPYKKVFNILKGQIFNIIRSSIIGTFVGSLPGAGGAVSNLISYDQAKKASKDPEEFGEGCPEGIIASEAANNGTAGGALIPTLALGVPGTTTTAVMLGVLMVHDLRPGPAFFREQPMLVSGFFLAFIIAHFFMVSAQFSIGSKFFLKVTRIPVYTIIPNILMLAAVGCLAINNRIFDVWTFLTFGVIGYILKKAKYPLAPIIIGLILGPIAELNFRRAFSMDPNPVYFFTRPISLVLLVLTFISLGISFYQIYKERKNK